MPSINHPHEFQTENNSQNSEQWLNKLAEERGPQIMGDKTWTHIKQLKKPKKDPKNKILENWKIKNGGAEFMSLLLPACRMYSQWHNFNGKIFCSNWVQVVQLSSAQLDKEVCGSNLGEEYQFSILFFL